jgi:hypothetical protein
MTACFVAAGADADQKLYRWTDANGRVFYTDKPPPTDARNVERKRLGDRAGSGPLPYATQMAAKSFPVTLYTSDCGEACDEGRKLLEARGVPYAEKAARDQDVQAELLKLTGGTSVEVPVLVVGRTIVRGWEATQWHSTLDAAGYPKSSPVRPQAAAATRKSGAGTPTELSRNARDPALPQPARPQPATDQTP